MTYISLDIISDPVENSFLYFSAMKYKLLMARNDAQASPYVTIFNRNNFNGSKILCLGDLKLIADTFLLYQPLEYAYTT